MKLYYYDHCPFCVRVRMIFGLRDIPFDGIILANDDEETPNQLIGRKMLPILIKDNGEAMGESLDIVRYVDGLSDGDPLDETVRDALQHWLDDVSAYGAHLISPRDILVGFAEFATDSAVAYFTRKKTENVGDFAENIANTTQYITRMASDLARLEKIILSPAAANGKALSMEDILLFPLLRNLTMVRAISWPTGVRAYLAAMAEASKVDLLFDRAV